MLFGMRPESYPQFSSFPAPSPLWTSCQSSSFGSMMSKDFLRDEGSMGSKDLMRGAKT